MALLRPVALAVLAFVAVILGLWVTSKDVAPSTALLPPVVNSTAADAAPAQPSPAVEPLTREPTTDAPIAVEAKEAAAWPRRALHVKTGFSPDEDTGRGSKSFSFKMPENLPSGLVLRGTVSSIEIQDSFLPPNGISYDGRGATGAAAPKRPKSPPKPMDRVGGEDDEVGRELSVAEILAMVGEAQADAEKAAAMSDEEKAAAAAAEVAAESATAPASGAAPEGLESREGGAGEAPEFYDDDDELEPLTLMPQARDWICLKISESVGEEGAEAAGDDHSPWVVRQCHDHPVGRKSLALHTDPATSPLLPGHSYTLTVECGKECQFSAVGFVVLAEFDQA